VGQRQSLNSPPAKAGGFGLRVEIKSRFFRFVRITGYKKSP